jgi:hypothetical protein
MAGAIFVQRSLFRVRTAQLHCASQVFSVAAAGASSTSETIRRRWRAGTCPGAAPSGPARTLGTSLIAGGALAHYGVESMLASPSGRNDGTHDRCTCDTAIEEAPGRKADSGYLALERSTGDSGTSYRCQKPSGVAPFRGGQGAARGRELTDQEALSRQSGSS